MGSSSNQALFPICRPTEKHLSLHPVARAKCRVHESLQFEKSFVESFELLHLSRALPSVWPRSPAGRGGRFRTVALFALNPLRPLTSGRLCPLPRGPS